MAGALDRLEARAGDLVRPAVSASDWMSSRSSVPTTTSVGTSISAEARLGRDSGQTARTSPSNGQLLLVGAERHRLRQLAHVGRGVGGEPHPRLLRGRRRRDRRARSPPLPRRSRPAPPPTSSSEPRPAPIRTSRVDELGPRRRELERDPAAEGAADDGRRRRRATRPRSRRSRRSPGSSGASPKPGRSGASARWPAASSASICGCPHPAVRDARVQEQDVTHRRTAAAAARRTSPGRSWRRPPA